MNVTDFKQMYLAELQELYSAEDQLAKALPGMAEMAHNPQLKGAMEGHLGQTQSHVQRLESILKRHNIDPREHQDQSMKSIIGEADKWAHMIENPDLRDAGLISSAQRIGHYEIAVYGTLATWAKRLGQEDDANTLHAICEEEKNTDEKLTELAKSTVNAQAV
jgi:ferritin-like metal-binding protein YciE